MASTVNVLVLVHGMITDRRPTSHTEQYARFRRGLAAHQGDLFEHIDEVVEVEWGHEPPDTAPQRPDQFLSKAQRMVSDRVRYEVLKGAKSDLNVLVRDWLFIPFARSAALGLREGIVQFGLADALYYAAPDGERAVRRTVYQQALAALDRHEDADEVRLHVVAHSLGVTVAHDFLYGLFTAGAASDFRAQGGDAVPQFEHWQTRATGGTLRLGSFVSMASQLPLFVMRKQGLVQRLAGGQLLDPAVIGVTAQDHVQWLILYDVDDVLGFATRRLYADSPAIKDRQVKTGGLASAHTGYWEEETVLAESAGLIYTNARR